MKPAIGGYQLPVKNEENQNFMILVGTGRGFCTQADSKLIKDSIRNFQNLYDKQTLTI